MFQGSVTQPHAMQRNAGGIISGRAEISACRCLPVDLADARIAAGRVKADAKGRPVMEEESNVVLCLREHSGVMCASCKNPLDA
jgi:hypothetical protein